MWWSAAECLKALWMAVALAGILCGGVLVYQYFVAKNIRRKVRACLITSSTIPQNNFKTQEDWQKFFNVFPSPELPLPLFPWSTAWDSYLQASPCRCLVCICTTTSPSRVNFNAYLFGHCISVRRHVCLVQRLGCTTFRLIFPSLTFGDHAKSAFTVHCSENTMLLIRRMRQKSLWKQFLKTTLSRPSSSPIRKYRPKAVVFLNE